MTQEHECNAEQALTGRKNETHLQACQSVDFLACLSLTFHMWNAELDKHSNRISVYLHIRGVYEDEKNADAIFLIKRKTSSISKAGFCWMDGQTTPLRVILEMFMAQTRTRLTHRPP